MDFTREPIIETIITPKDGCKLAVRSSKGAGQEEYFVEALEVVAFGHALFFRSLERPKSFLVPVSDYEVIEVREARMVLKNLGPDRSIKIGGGRESSSKGSKEIVERIETAQPQEEVTETTETEKVASESTEARSEGSRLDKKRDRRRHYRKRRNGKEEVSKEEGPVEITGVPPLEEGGKVTIPAPGEIMKIEDGQEAVSPPTSSLLSSLLQPPPTLISETINRYRENALFKNAFFLTEEEQYKPHDKVQELLNEEDDFTAPLQEPAFEDSVENEQEQQEKFDEVSDVQESDVSSSESHSTESFYFTEQKAYPEEHESENKGNQEAEADFRQALEEVKNEEVALPLYAEESLNGNYGHEEEGFHFSQEDENFQFEESNDLEERKHSKDSLPLD